MHIYKRVNAAYSNVNAKEIKRAEKRNCHLKAFKRGVGGSVCNV
jgi:hypothetical protein